MCGNILELCNLEGNNKIILSKTSYNGFNIEQRNKN